MWANDLTACSVKENCGDDMGKNGGQPGGQGVDKSGGRRRQKLSPVCPQDYPQLVHVLLCAQPFTRRNTVQGFV